jgi:hypothetical protein
MSILRTDALRQGPGGTTNDVTVSTNTVVDMSSSSKSLVIPRGTEAQRDVGHRTLSSGGDTFLTSIRHNIDTNEIETWNGTRSSIATSTTTLGFDYGPHGDWEGVILKDTSSNADIVTNGLIYHINPLDLNSYNADEYTNRMFDISGKNTRFPAQFFGNTNVDVTNGLLDLTDRASTADYVSISDQVMVGMTRWTIDWWLYQTSNNSISTFFTCGATNDILFFFNSSFQLEYQNGGGSNTTSEVIGSLNELIHVCAVANNGTLDIYKNGLYVTTISRTTTVAVPGFAGIVLGQEYDNNASPGNFDAGQKYRGKYGPMKIYNRNLTANEVLQNYNAVKPDYQKLGFSLV